MGRPGRAGAQAPAQRCHRRLRSLPALRGRPGLRGSHPRAGDDAAPLRRRRGRLRRPPDRRRRHPERPREADARGAPRGGHRLHLPGGTGGGGNHDRQPGCGQPGPLVVADAGYGVSTPFRLGLEERGLAYVLALTGKEVAHRENARPHRPAYGGLGPPTLPRYRTPPRAVCALTAEAGAGRFTEVTWRQGSKGAMTSRFAVLTVRPAGKQSLAAAQRA
ncbi:transposase, partial [Streptomyces sp. C1-2]|uniref:transposase n=1 Tax=Streptomyces sp. C1-2 TaxID=2720022 RepID=UPI001F0D97EC